MVPSCWVVLSALVSVGQGDWTLVGEVALAIAAGAEVVPEADRLVHSIYLNCGFPGGGPLFGKAASGARGVAATFTLLPSFSFLRAGWWWCVVPSVSLLAFSSLVCAPPCVGPRVWICPLILACSLALVLYWVADGSS